MYLIKTVQKYFNDTDIGLKEAAERRKKELFLSLIHTKTVKKESCVFG